MSSENPYKSPQEDSSLRPAKPRIDAETLFAAAGCFLAQVLTTGGPYSLLPIYFAIIAAVFSCTRWMYPKQKRMSRAATLIISGGISGCLGGIVLAIVSIGVADRLVAVEAGMLIVYPTVFGAVGASLGSMFGRAREEDRRRAL